MISIVVGLALGAYAGWKRGGMADRVGNGVSLILYSMPYFVIGMPLIIIFAASLHWFPTSGMLTPGATYDSPVDQLARLRRATSSCRSSTVSLGLIGGYSIIMRSVDHRDPLRGLHRRRPGPRASRTAAILRAARVPERAAADGHDHRDQPRLRRRRRDHGRGRLQLAGSRDADRRRARRRATTRSSRAIFLLLSVTVVVANLVADLVYGFLDPRVRS